ncbi:MAG TPA: deaminase, partial [Acidobacteriota bacterium]
MIIGLTGKNGAGKGEVATFLKDKSFYYYSLSDVIREELESRGVPVTRETLIITGNDMRQRFGPDVLARLTIKKLDPNRNYVIDSIRNPAEVNALRSKGSFVLINVDAPSEVRFERIRARARENDPATLEEFRAIEQAESRNLAEHKQSIEETQALADYTIINDGPVEALQQSVTQLVSRILQTPARPGWDEYFMSIAQVVASRSNCVKRKVAAIIVKDRRIISTGYNGTPRGTRNCNEGGCPRCNSLAASGTALEECYCSHGEENAITQASYHGISLKDGMLYTTFSPCLLCTKMII